MNGFLKTDTIAAVSTPPGTGGIAVIRVSGPDAIKSVDRFFVGVKPLKNTTSHKACFGKVMQPAITSEDPVFLDEVVVVVFRAPKSYTNEDVVEISCHGGRYITLRLLELILGNGVRLAEPGEFTQRAFLNGRLDLSQAEAVGDLINAKTAASHRGASAQFNGVLSERVRSIRQSLIDLCSLIELELDFAEEDVEFADRAELALKLQDLNEELLGFSQSYQRGKILREGALLAIIGRPNVGKSSLLNALLKEDRAIVSDISGTTRDVLEEQIDIRGVLFRIVDTAGVRQASDEIERMGVERSYQKIKEADILLFMFDGSQVLTPEDKELISAIDSIRTSPDATLPVINKCDLARALKAGDLHEIFGLQKIFEISAIKQTGLNELEEKLVEIAVPSACDNEPIITNLRQKKGVDDAIGAIARALQTQQKGMSGEFVAIDLQAAIQHLGEIIGTVTSEDILDNIFSNFCIGK